MPSTVEDSQLLRATSITYPRRNGRPPISIDIIAILARTAPSPPNSPPTPNSYLMSALERVAD
jgi:hypothetical protein